MPGWARLKQANMTTKLAAVLLAMLAGLLLVGGVSAHGSYGRSEPGADAIIASAPTQVSIWFEQDLFRRPSENRIVVTGPSGEVQAGEAKIDDDNRRLMVVALLPNLAPGTYTVAWRTLSAEDGEADEGEFVFTLDPEAQVTSTPMSAEPTPTDLPATPVPATLSPTGTPAPAGGFGCGGALAPAIGLVGVGIGARLRRRRAWPAG